MATIKLGLVGENISYSLSPRLHKLLFEYFGITNASYQLIDILQQDFDSQIRKVSAEYFGFNVTKPYKNLILPYITNNFSEVISVNTCVSNNGLQGYNTDIGGFKKSFCDFTKPPYQSALLLGAGGAAASVACALRNLKIKTSIYNRTFDSGVSLADRFGHTAITFGTAIKPQIIINCTTLGLLGEMSLPDFVDTSSVEFCYDTIYNPPLTPFLQKAQQEGAKVLNGFGMLVYQAILSQNIWFDLHLSKAQQEGAYNYVLNNF